MATSESTPVSPQGKEPRRRADYREFSASRIALIYLVAGLVWIGVSDFSLAQSGSLTRTGLLLAAGKGALFVALSSLLVYWLSRKEYSKSRQANELVRAVIEGTNDVVYVKDLEGRYLLANDAAARTIGLSIEQILGRNDYELFSRHEAERMVENDRVIFARKEVVSIEERVTFRDRTWIYESTKAPYFDETGEVVGVIGISRNITEHKTIESAFRETEARLREAQRIAKLGSWSWEPEAGNVWWSDAEFELFGVDPKLVKPSFEAFVQLLHPDDRGTAYTRVEAMLAGANEFANDLRLLRSDGTWIWIHSQARATRDKDGKIIRVEGIDQDITAQKVAEEEVLDSKRKLQAAVEVAGLGVIVIDYENQTADLSTRAAEQFGFPNEIVVSRSELHNRIHVDDRDQIEQLRECALDPSGSGWFSYEHRIVRPDGDIRWVNVCKQVSFVGGRPYRAIVVTADVTDKRIANERIREQEMLVREAAELAQLGGWGFDPDTLQGDWTPVVSSMYGLAPGAVPPVEKALEFFDAKHRDELIAALQAAISNGTPHDMELQLHGADGKSRWVRTICRPIVENGKVIRVRGSLQDITDRVEATESLRKSEARYRQLVDMLPTAIFVHGENRILFGNVAFARLFGANEISELLGRSPFELVHPSCYDLLRRRQEELERTGSSVAGCDMLGVRVDGKVVPVHVVAASVEGYGKRATLVALTDLTERERAIALLRSVLDSVGDAIVTTNVRGIVTSANRATERLFGYRVEELIGKNVSLLMPENHQREHDRYIADYVRTRIPRVIGIGREVEGRRKDGTSFPAELTISEFVRDGEQEFTGVLRDITARRQLEEQFRQAQKMEAVGRLAGGVAHDFNNLLTVINGYSELVLSELPLEHDSRGALVAIRDAGDRASRLTEQLLAFSRKSMVEIKLVELNELVLESAKLLRRLIGEDITLTVKTEQKPMFVMIDPGQLEQVFMNLVVNARDAMPTGGALTIETRNVVLNRRIDPVQADLPDGEYASLSVTDTGSGMTSDVRERAFEPFFTTKGIGKGTGLGLSVVHGIVQQAGGAIRVDSRISEGTSFQILLPAVNDSVPVSAPLEPSIVPRGDETILVVEDEDAVRKLVRVALEGQGYTVLTASNAKEGLAQLLAHSKPIDLLLTDVIMPEASGSELAATLRKTQPDLRVLLMSGYTNDALDRHGLEGTADQLIQKPFSPLSLARRVREILDNPQ